MGWLAGVVEAAPIISEIVASNEASAVDEDGEASDWLEIYNPDPTAVDLQGWHLTDNAGDPAKWTFPAGVTLEPGGFLRVWASGKDRTQNPAALHTNFSLSASGEYLALIAPNGTAASEFSPGFPALERDESYGIPFETTTLVAVDAAASVLIPADGSLGTTWTQRDFTPGAGWTTGPAPLGFGSSAPGFYIEERASSAAITSITIAEQVLNGTNATDKLEALRPMVNITSGGFNDGHFEDGLPPLHGEADNYALRASATLIIPEAGLYTFHVRSDDGFRLRLDGTIISQFTSTRNPANTFTTRELTAGEHSLVLSFFGNAGDDELELSAAKVTETTTTVTDAFRLIGDTANGGLAVIAPPNPLLPEITTDLEEAMKGRNASAYVRVPFTVTDPAVMETLSLALAYNDGFVAYLNGTEVARDNAPATAAFDSAATAARPALASLEPVSFNISRHRSLLVAGANVLAIHGLNAAAGDDSFLLAPQLLAGRRASGSPLFFTTPTPGAPNPATGVLGHTMTPSFAPERGFQTAPIQVTLASTNGATIRYTTDGSTPTRENGTTYTAPIAVSATTVLRAAAFLDGYADSADVTHTYLFLDDVIAQPSARPGVGWPNPGTTGGQKMDYAMDTRIVNHANPDLGGPEQTKAALRALPTLSLTTDLPNLFHASTGIYNHATNRGRTWERRASLELIAAPGEPEPGFHVNMGLRLRGGYSRSGDNPKHAFRAFFRREYGAGKLDYPIFPDDPTAATEFDKFDIQCSQNYSWSFGTSDINAKHNALREIWARDAQLDLGQPSTRGRFVHLYLNGVYWGIYQIQERAEANWGESYLGGNADDYDIVKNDRAGAIEATDGYYLTMPDGSDAAWKKLWTATRASYFINSDRNPASPYAANVFTPEEKLAAYYKVQGLLADGRTRSGDPVLLDVDNLIDYYILIVLTRNSDSGLSLGGQSPNNFYTARNRLGDFGFVSISHDGEHSMDAQNSAERWGPFDSPTGTYWNNIAYSNPIYYHQDLFASAEYRMRFADRIYRHFFHNGPLTAAANQARLDRRATEIEPAIIAESARWGDSTSGTPRTIATWRTARNDTRNFFTNRSTVYLTEARNRGYYPSIDPPEFNQRGGEITAGFQATLANPNPTGVIYYTTDGSDPRPVGGGFAPLVLLPEFSPASYLVPSEANGGSALTKEQWTSVAAPPNAAAWTSGPLGFGFNPANRPATTNFTPFIKTDVKAALQPEGGTPNGSLYVRAPLTLTAEQLAAMKSLRLRVRYDDAYICWLNGQEVVRKGVNAAFNPAWNSVSGTVRTDAAAIGQDEVFLADFQSLLVAGENVFAFQVMNQTASGNDLLFSPEIVTDVTSGTAGQAYTGPLTLNAPTFLKTRVLDGTTWSALNEAYFITPAVPASAANIVVSEFHYAPLGPQTPAESGYEGKDFEFLELLNIGAQPVDLNGVAFTQGVTYTFAGVTPVPPGGRVVLAVNVPAFTRRYGVSVPVLGPYDGNLNNAGETLRLTATDGVTIIKEFTYSPNAPWPTAADGNGPSLVLIDPTANPAHGNATSWKASALPNGSPGAAEPELSGYASWKAAHGGLDDDADPDGDGLGVLLEYALGGSPTTNDRALQPTGGVQALAVGGVTADYLTLTFTRPAGVTDVDYLAESSPSLIAESWSPTETVLVSQTSAGDGAETLVFRSAQPVTPGQRLFLRLRVRVQE